MLGPQTEIRVKRLIFPYCESKIVLELQNATASKCRKSTTSMYCCDQPTDIDPQTNKQFYDFAPCVEFYISSAAVKAFVLHAIQCFEIC